MCFDNTAHENQKCLATFNIEFGAEGEKPKYQQSGEVIQTDLLQIIRID